MIEITCPTSHDTIHNFHAYKSVFIAGGISNCPDWQQDMLALLRTRASSIVTMNPRRDDFDITDLDSSSFQIEWEHEHLAVADAVLFWFPKETLCPITLYELGVITTRDAPRVFVGCHPEYARRFDVIKQLSLSRPDITVHSSMESLAHDVNEWIDLY